MIESQKFDTYQANLIELAKIGISPLTHIVQQIYLTDIFSRLNTSTLLHVAHPKFPWQLRCYLYWLSDFMQKKNTFVIYLVYGHFYNLDPDVLKSNARL